MRSPNGFGTVVRLSGNRRNPFMVKKTIGWNQRGFPVFDIIGYYPTREAALIALAQYNSNPWNIDDEKITLADLFTLWLEKKFPKLGHSNQSSLKSAYKHCKSLYKTKYKEIRAYQMQYCIDQCGYGSSIQAAIKNLFHHLDRFALEMDIVNKCYSELLTTESAPETSKQPFTNEEVDRIWAIQHEPWVDSVLVFLYSGWRISELLDLKTADVDLQIGTMTGGTKTKAGKNRIVPIHSLIAEMVSKRVSEGGEYLFSCDGGKCEKTKYYSLWNDIMKRTNMSHTPHECRHTFRTWLDRVGANRVAINKIMGYSGGDTSERVYTHKTIQDLKFNIELVTR